MISEQDKQAILNGEHGITRDGRKAFLIGFTERKQPVFEISTQGKHWEEKIYTYLSDFSFLNNTIHSLDVIGLWKRRIKPFNLEEALQGKPVRLRCGHKAYVEFIFSNPRKAHHDLHGYYLDLKNTRIIRSWTIDGYAFNQDHKNDYDIIGMWKD